MFKLRMDPSLTRNAYTALLLYKMPLVLTCYLCIIMSVLEWNSILTRLNL